jgi:hypothetical protein
MNDGDIEDGELVSDTKNNDDIESGEITDDIDCVVNYDDEDVRVFLKIRLIQTIN